MSRNTINLTEKVYDYLLSASLRESPVLQQLREETASHTQAAMRNSPEHGQFMALLINMLGARRIIELAVFTGDSPTLME